MKPLLERLKDPAPLLFDGAFGTELFARGVELPNSALANEQHPDAVVDVHAAYLEAGSDLIETNTFVASSLHLDMASAGDADPGELATRAVELARRAVDRTADQAGRPAYVMGSLGPSPGAIEADTGESDFGLANDRVRAAHQQVAEALARAGVDGFAVETMFSAKEAAIAVDVARQFGLPISVSMTCKYTGDRPDGAPEYRTDWGHSPADLLDNLASGELSGGDDLLPHVHLLGLNCGAESEREEHTGMTYAIHGAHQYTAALADRHIEGKHLIAYPNAGLPSLDETTGRTTFRLSPGDMAAQLPAVLAAGIQVIGGCCGTTPAHIAAFRKVLDQK